MSTPAHPLVDGPETIKEGSRAYFVKSAALALMLDPQVGINIAGVPARAFVQSARKTYKAYKFGFSDSDIREIHRQVRKMVSAMASKGELPKVNEVGGVLRG